MKWLILLLLPFVVEAQGLKPGTYYNLKPTEPLVLDTGSYTFIGLEMKDLGNGIWLDAREARKLELLHCSFEGKDEGIAVLSSGNLVVSHCSFANMKDGILQASPPGSFRKVSITYNLFTNNLTSIRLEVEKDKCRIINPMIGVPGFKPGTAGIGIGLKRDGSTGTATLDFTLKCNNFSQTTPTLSGEERIGLLIGQGVGLLDDRIGGNNQNQTGPPNGNYFPRNGAGLNAGPVTGYVSIKNESSNLINYWSYGNELMGNVVPAPNSGLPNRIALPLLPQNTFIVNDQNIVAHCAATSNCGLGSLADCSTEVLSSSACTGNVQWVKACAGGPTDNVSWPVAFRVAVDPGPNQISSTVEALGNKETELGQSIPNPGRDKIDIPIYLSESSGTASLQIIELATGKTVAQFLVLKPGETRLNLDVSQYAAGMYAYKLLPAKGKAPKALNFVIIR